MDTCAFDITRVLTGTLTALYLGMKLYEPISAIVAAVVGVLFFIGGPIKMDHDIQKREAEKTECMDDDSSDDCEDLS